MRHWLRFIGDYSRYSFRGSKAYYLWLGLLLACLPVWLYGGYQQYTQGLAVTGLSDQVSWGLYTANFIFWVGIAAGAVTVIFPAYVYQHQALKKVAVLGEILAVCAVALCLLFIVFHMGRPDRLWHMIPTIGIFNFPNALLAWDMLVLLGYFLLNIIAASHVLYAKYSNTPVRSNFYLPLVFISIFWAISIHTVTAFLLNTLPARPVWHHSVMPIRFIATAFATGPALLIMVFLIIRNNTKLWIENEAIDLLSTIVVACLTLTLFLTLSEVVTTFYHPNEHSAGLRYLIVGHASDTPLTPWFWMSLLLLFVAWLALLFPRLRKNYALLPYIAIMVVIGIWVEKGIALIIPGSIPTSLGEYPQYLPTWIELGNSLGNWAIGLLIFTLLTKGAVGVLTGEVRHNDALTGSVLGNVA